MRTFLALLLSCLVLSSCGGSTPQTVQPPVQELALAGRWAGFFPGSSAATPRGQREGLEVWLGSRPEKNRGWIIDATRRLGHFGVTVEQGSGSVHLVLEPRRADDIKATYDGTFVSANELTGFLQQGDSRIPLDLRRYPDEGSPVSARQEIQPAGGDTNLAFTISASNMESVNVVLIYGFGVKDAPGQWQATQESTLIGGLAAGDTIVRHLVLDDYWYTFDCYAPGNSGLTDELGWAELYLTDLAQLNADNFAPLFEGDPNVGDAAFDLPGGTQYFSGILPQWTAQFRADYSEISEFLSGPLPCLDNAEVGCIPATDPPQVDVILDDQTYSTYVPVYQLINLVGD